MKVSLIPMEHTGENLTYSHLQSLLHDLFVMSLEMIPPENFIVIIKNKNQETSL